MPINYAKPNYDFYYQNWAVLWNRLNNRQLFNSLDLQQLFWDSWRDRLISSEEKSKNLFHKLHLENLEHFPIRLSIDSTFVGWTCIYIDLIEKIIYKEQIPPINVPSNLFRLGSLHIEQHGFEKTNKILYQPRHQNIKALDMPILVYNPSFARFSPIVIDGNNRVYFALNNNIENIPSYVLTEYFFLDYPEVFLDEFCKDIFYFLADYHFFSNNKFKKPIFSFKSHEKEFSFFKANSFLYK